MDNGSHVAGLDVWPHKNQIKLRSPEQPVTDWSTCQITHRVPLQRFQEPGVEDLPVSDAFKPRLQEAQVPQGIGRVGGREAHPDAIVTTIGCTGGGAFQVGCRGKVELDTTLGDGGDLASFAV